jgi:ADP-ribosyl-[dinitrogen reductase] hydrolase
MWRGERSRNGGVDRIPVPGVDGELWLCGKHFIGPDVEAAVERVGADVVLCLNEHHELADRYPAYVAWLRRDDRAWWVPIPDLHAPTLDEAVELIESLVTHLRAGRTVLAHCGAGIGRAGTVAAAVLVALGATVDDAVSSVAANRPLAGPEAGAQEALLHALEARH